MNANRPADSDVPVAKFSPIGQLDRSLPEWLCFSAGYRARFEGFDGGGFTANSSDAYLLTRFRLGVSVRPSSWFRLYAEVQDATVFWKAPPLGPPNQSTWDLRRAHLDFGDLEKSPVAFRIGRQDLNFGYGRLVGTSYWRNASRGFDAAKIVLRWRRLRLDALSASPVVANANGLSHHQQGNNLHGLYAGVRNAIPGSVIEPYLFWRLSPGFKTEAGRAARIDEKTIGLRWAGTALKFDYDAEAAVQTGAAGADRIRSWAWAAIAGYTFRSARFQPRAFVEYNYASGDRNPKDGTRGTFDQLYPNIHDHHGLADQIAWQNLREFRGGLRLSLRPEWTLAVMYNDWWLASAKDGFYNSSGGVVARDPGGRSGSHIGEEFDLESSYRPTRNLEFGAGLGRVLPGGFLARAHRNLAYTYPYITLNYSFY